MSCVRRIINTCHLKVYTHSDFTVSATSCCGVTPHIRTEHPCKLVADIYTLSYAIRCKSSRDNAMVQMSCTNNM